MVELLIVGAIGYIAGAVTVIVFSKNNKNTIASAREEILSAAARGQAELNKTLDKYSG